ncbi:MAG: 50S ribosomal protein L35 [bacterium]|nr:50S ribosomal protein L35 [Candidatus Kapabacteria bacterium]
MPKMKTVKGAAKRFKVTGSGKLKRESAFRSHMLNCKSPKRLRNLRQAQLVDSSDEKRIERCLGLR